MSNRKQSLLRAAQDASRGYAHARQQLSDSKDLSAKGIRTELMSLAAIEHGAYHRWRHAMEAFTACPN